MALRSEKTAPTAMPNSRNGRSSSQMNGNATSASTASGQLNRNRQHQRRNAIKNFITSSVPYRRELRGFHTHRTQNPDCKLRKKSHSAETKNRAPSQVRGLSLR